MAVNAKGEEITSIWTPANIVTCVRIVFIPLFMIASEFSFEGFAAGGNHFGITAGAWGLIAFVLVFPAERHRQDRRRFGAQARGGHGLRQVPRPDRRQAAGLLRAPHLARARPDQRLVRVHHLVPRVPRERPAHGGERERRGHRGGQARQGQDRRHHGVAVRLPARHRPRVHGAAAARRADQVIRIVAEVSMFAAVVLTVVSGAQYFWNARHIIFRV